MKRIKNVSCAAIATMLIMAVSPLFGQAPGGQGRGQGQGQGQGRQMTEEDVKQRVERLSETLEMNEEQKSKIMKYELDSFKKREVERQKYQGDRDAMREQMRKMREERDKVYKETLTEEQMKKYTELQEQRRQQMQNRQPRNPGEPPEGDRPPRGRGRG